MGEQERKIQLTITLAQYDVLQAAIQEILTDNWHSDSLRRNDRHTLKRVMNRFITAWDEGVKH